MRIGPALLCALAALALPVPAAAVVGGTPVPSGGYGYAVAIGDTDGAYCGGTLIAPAVVLTAAHCITARPTSLARLRVLAGTRTIGADLALPDGDRVRGVTAVYVHPKFSQTTMRYDAALLVLDGAPAGVPVIPLTAATPRAGSSVTAAGWGTTGEGASAVAQLRSVGLTVATASSCRRGNARLGPLFAPSMLCASGPRRDTCSGDSGGPLVGRSHGRAVLVGITSFGDGCARAGKPGIYTRVSAIRAWTLGQLGHIAAAELPAASAA
jgi:secreted trypsin-like serine protease